MTTTHRVTGKIAELEMAFYRFVATDASAPPAHRIIYLERWQLRSANVGDRVVLEYRSSASRGSWVVVEVLT